MSDHSREIEMGNLYPYDNDSELDDREPPVDWAHTAARAILYDLNDRRGIKESFAGVDHSIRVEIVEKMAGIIRQAEAGQ